MFGVLLLVVVTWLGRVFDTAWKVEEAKAGKGGLQSHKVAATQVFRNHRQWQLGHHITTRIPKKIMGLRSPFSSLAGNQAQTPTRGG